MNPRHISTLGITVEYDSSGEQWGVIFPKYLNDGEPDWLMICEDQYHARRFSTELKARNIKALIVSRPEGANGWTEVGTTPGGE